MDAIILKRAERRELERWVRGQSRDAAQGRRARLILLLADGERYGLIRDKLDCDTNFIARWKSRFVAERLAGLYSRHAGRAVGPGSERQEARILKWTTQRKPVDGSTHWSSRKLALELGDVSHTQNRGVQLAQARAARPDLCDPTPESPFSHLQRISPRAEADSNTTR